MRILVVEDEVLARRALVKIIRQISEHHHIVGEAGGGEEALEIVRDTYPDLIFTDIRMPAMDGLTLADRLRAMGCAASVVIISGYSDFGYAQKAIRYGVKEYLLKPFTFQEIEDILMRIEGQRRRDYQIGESQGPPGIERRVLPEIHTEHPLIRRALSIIGDNIGKACGLSEIAGLLSVSPEHLSRLFRAEIGITFSQYVTAAKMDFALSLLRNTDLKIIEVAQVCGYQNVKYFYRVFKDVCGISTTEYLRFFRQRL